MATRSTAISPAFVEVEAGLEPGQDRQRLGLALAALDIVAARGREGHGVERLQQLLVHDLDEPVRRRAFDPAGQGRRSDSVRCPPKLRLYWYITQLPPRRADQLLLFVQILIC